MEDGDRSAVKKWDGSLFALGGLTPRCVIDSRPFYSSSIGAIAHSIWDKEMSTSYYPVSAIIDGRQVYFLWYTNDTDGVLCGGAEVRAFRSLNDCLQFARYQRWTVADTVTVYDFDSVSDWLQHYEDAPIDPIMLLDAWNLTEDFVRSVGASDAQFSLTGHRVYDKLFAANNLPAMQAASGGLVADWNDEDRAEIASQLSLPFNMFRQSILAG